MQRCSGVLFRLTMTGEVGSLSCQPPRATSSTQSLEMPFSTLTQPPRAPESATVAASDKTGLFPRLVVTPESHNSKVCRILARCFVLG